ncbi:guanine nucleotide-releasing factor 2 isoform X2 [Musca domestica]|uniref:Guanine nucleotide-releasing factor 2 isoform X2 n=1 Tax=Musca domestica TaxID=7370 RepID=A0ABM3UW01_MUSDO|nr:guanine nucleotide-releasing factor 2 isoform X2 [Musca domestica]
MMQDSVISTPSTPNSSLSSQSNLYGSPNTSPATPTQQSSTPLVGNNTTGSSGHKNSLKGTKFARRARSFKDDLISMMRTQTNTLGRSHSPQSPRHKNKPPPTAEEVAKSSQSLDIHVKDITNALKHFKDVILKKKLEVLPGNGTVILETTACMLSAIQAYTLNENNTTLLSATQQVQKTLGKLIKLCDEVMLSEDSEECASLSNDNVRDIIDSFAEAVRNLATLAQESLKERRDFTFQYDVNATEAQTPTTTAIGSNNTHNLLMRPSVEVAGQRTSLPDITLTPKERDILEKTTSNPMHASYSTENILRDSSPPPKPPLPNRSHNPPPLPPKKNSQPVNQSLTNYDTSINSSDAELGVDHLTVRSCSPDENSSQCSLDQSRDEEEYHEFNLAYKYLAEGIGAGGGGACGKDNGIKAATTRSAENPIESNIIQKSGKCDLSGGVITEFDEEIGKTELRKVNNHRHSNESGFHSNCSIRTSTQSYSKHSSDVSFQSSTKSSNSTSELTYMCSNNSINEDFFQQHHQQQQISSTKKTASVCISSTSTSSISETSALRILNDDERRISSPDQFEAEKKLLEKFQAMSTTSSSTSSAIVKQSNSLDITSTEDILATLTNDIPPALPPKTSRLPKVSSYDSDTPDNSTDIPELRRQVRTFQWQSKHKSLDPRRLDMPAGSCSAINMGLNGQLEEPPPLPIKKKHILAYMEICSASTQRHTVHAYNLNRNITHSQTMNIATTFAQKDLQEVPPALPPKNYKQWKNSSTATAVGSGGSSAAVAASTSSSSSSPIPPPTIITTPPPSPKPSHLTSDHRILSLSGGNEIMSTVSEEVGDQYDDDTGLIHSHELQNVYDTSMPRTPTSPTLDKMGPNGDYSSEVEEMVNYNNCNRMSPLSTEEINHLPNILEEVDVRPYLIFKKENEEGPDVKGGYIDALIVHASRVENVTDKVFTEAFITTFRTFIQPIDLIEKLTHRYTVFFCQLNDPKKKSANETFSLLVRVLNDLTCTDLTSRNLRNLIVEFVYELVCAGELYCAKLLHNKFVEKFNIYNESRMPAYPSTDMFSIVSAQPSLLDFKAMEIAKQMTLLDAELFQKIEIPEVLMFAKDQCEEKSPNLNKFTEHFNKMSYWVRSKILTLNCAKEREKYVEKFIKIMSHLKKIHNYNSYLALLSALDSAPIRRLEWNKSIKETLKNNCNIIDSSSSFRNYRKALEETSPPCIPYIGLVLQDLTFVHVGNPDYLKDGVVNFSKRWQQYKIIENMKRFKTCSYTYRRNERIIRFFENFENFLGEEEMWQISETIKPRVGKRMVVNN